MASAQMELCQWENTAKSIKGSGDSKGNTSPTAVLGLCWDRTEDKLYCAVPEINYEAPITKRTVLSLVSKIFDPIGVLCPALLPAKLILQQAWAAKLGWDDDLPDQAKSAYIYWLREIEHFRTLSIPRNITGGCATYQELQLHVFSDASQEAYAAAVYLRADNHKEVSVQLLAAKARVAPMKKATIPRLELLGCVIAVRLANQVKMSLTLPIASTCYWSDSTTAIAWIKRHDDWGTFVNNRVKEIRTMTTPEEWRHIPGSLNPADLPSRGCNPKHLVESRWWEGPNWLKNEWLTWPTTDVQVNEEEVCQERLKSSILVASLPAVTKDPWYTKPFSAYHRNVRVVAWVRRFVDNVKEKSHKTGPLTLQDLSDAEHFMFRMVQEETFSNKSEVLKQLRVIKDEKGILRIGTKLFHVEGDYFRTPILLPGNHILVEQLIRHEHFQSGHAGVQFLMSVLRERCWILKARQTIKRVLQQCKQCLRFVTKCYNPDPAGLPENRVQAASAFQVVGIDLAGPLFLKKGQKAWIVLFTCAVFRCVHLDWVLALSTEAFLESLVRFISTRGRPNVIYTDNGTNFTGANHLFRQLDWRKIEEYSSIRRIKWIFNPPAASWWGGWWERLIRTTKELLRRMLGRSRIDTEELRTCLAVVEAALNDRPLTVVSEDVDDLIPLTPAMFLRGVKSSEFPEYQEIGAKPLQETFQRKQKILLELQTRFRNEYLSQLVQRKNERVHIPSVGDVVLVGQDNKKRIEWPLARVMALIPGRDGKARVAQVKTTNGTLTRPIQKLYPLEISNPSEIATQETKHVAIIDEGENPKPVKTTSQVRTHYGRLVKQPSRFQAT